MSDRREQSRRYYEANSEKIREAVRRYYTANREKINAKRRERRRVREGRMVRNSPEHLAKISGANHYGWKGENATRESVHIWLRKHHPKTGTCERCGTEVGTIGPSGTHYAFLRHPDPYTRDRADYAELCVLCHKRMDVFDRKVRSFGIRVIHERL